jgi:hypothetical protein
LLEQVLATLGSVSSEPRAAVEYILLQEPVVLENNNEYLKQHSA